MRLACIDLGNTTIFRFVEDHQEETFEVINDMIDDNTLKISMLAGQKPVWEIIEQRLLNFGEEEARKGRTIEEFARYNDSSLDLSLQAKGKPLLINSFAGIGACLN